jgi:hypothetical protein
VGQNKQADEWVKGWGEAWIQGQIEARQTMLGQLIARDFPRVKVARKAAQLRDVAALQQLCLAINFKEVSNLVALRQRLDEAIKAQNQ